LTKTYGSIDVRAVHAPLFVPVDSEASVDALQLSRCGGFRGDGYMRGKVGLDSSEERLDELGRGEEDEVVGEDLGGAGEEM
jgi:hypothetical protein